MQDIGMIKSSNIGIDYDKSRLPPREDEETESDDKDESEEQNTVEEALKEHERIRRKDFRTEVEDFERLDQDRRSEILHEIRDVAYIDDSEWMHSNVSEGTIDVNWDKLRDEHPSKTRKFSKLESKYGNPAGLFKLSVDPKDTKFHPGDFYSLKLPETPEIDTLGHQIPEVRKKTAEDETYFRAYSIGNSPNDDYVDLYIKRIPNEEADKNSLTPVLDAKLEQTDEVILKGPEDDELELNEVSDRDAVYVATGTGMAPLKSMIDFTFEEKLDRCKEQDRNIWMFLGASWKDELPGHEELLELEEEHENFHYVPTVSREEYLSDWEGETQYVQKCLEKYSDEIGESYGLTEDEAAVYVCGLSDMAKQVRATVEELGFDTDSLSYQEEVFD